MRLIVVHQILIAAAIFLAGIFGLRSLIKFGTTGGTSNLLLALTAVVVGVLLAFYLRMVRAKWLQHKEHLSRS